MSRPTQLLSYSLRQYVTLFQSEAFKHLELAVVLEPFMELVKKEPMLLQHRRALYLNSLHGRSLLVFYHKY